MTTQVTPSSSVGPSPATAVAGEPSARGVPDGPVQAWWDRDGAVLQLRLARPKGNVLDAAMVAALGRALDEAAPTARLRAVVLGGAGPHFSFGASVTEHLPGAVEAMLAGFHALIRRLLSCPVPVLMAVRGSCLGGGLEVATAGSLLFVAPDAQLGQPEIRLGVFAPAASCVLPERVGQQVAEELLLSGRSMGGPEAVRRGLAFAEAADPEQAAMDWYDEHLAGLSAVAIRHALAAARGPFVERVSARLAEVENSYLTELMATHDATEGLTAFVEKRRAQWKDG